MRDDSEVKREENDSPMCVYESESEREVEGREEGRRLKRGEEKWSE